MREEDRPQLEEGEIYTRDLVGMRVILKVCVDNCTVFLKIWPCVQAYVCIPYSEFHLYP